MKKLINTNPLSDCALDHRPIDSDARLAYREVQEKVIRRNAVKYFGPVAENQPIEYVFDLCPQDIDYAMSPNEIEKIAKQLAEIRIQDAKNRG